MDCDGPTANAIGRYALSLLVRGRHAEAVTVMRRLVQSDPDPHAWGMLGLCLTVSHEAAVGTADDPRLAEAEIALRRGLADRPDEWQFVAALGYVLRVQGRLAEAEHAYRRVTEAVTGEADPFFARAALLQQLDRQAEIGPLFALLAAARPLDVELRLRIATFEFQRGDHAAAKRMLQDVLHLDPGNQPAIAGLRTLEAASGR
jgi:tetratricopeptide (TPR) repeat protein